MLDRLLIILLLLQGTLMAQNRIGTGTVSDLYHQHCASCHGADLSGGLGGSLITGEWKRIGSELSFIDYVANGNPAMGMPGFGDVLDRKQLRGIEIYIAEMQHQSARAGNPVDTKSGSFYDADGVRFTVETVVEDLDVPWALSFLPDGRGVFTLKAGEVHLMQQDGSTVRVEETPDDIWVHGQGGLLEIAPHPNYAENGWIYLAYSSSGGERDGAAQGNTKIVRGRIVDGKWLAQETVFETAFEFHRRAGTHFGTRFAFQDGYLFFSIGDRGAKDEAQDLGRPNGKVHRIYDDGRVPRDNPFVDQTGAYSTIWSYGNRNPQGLDFHPATGALWESEHGPRGGDEINRIERGQNYGWPAITYGMNYSGTPITDRTEAPGMAQPKLYWTPSIAVCGIDFYEGDRFPAWKNNLFAGGLASQELHRLVIAGGAVVEDAIVLKGEGRVRDVANGPDGALYLVLNKPGRIVRMVPAE